MATITGLQPPNPYAQAALKTPVRVRAAVSTQEMGNHAVSSSSSYSPDWMQGDHVAAAKAPDIYGAKGEPLKLPLTSPSTNK